MEHGCWNSFSDQDDPATQTLDRWVLVLQDCNSFSRIALATIGFFSWLIRHGIAARSIVRHENFRFLLLFRLAMSSMSVGLFQDLKYALAQNTTSLSPTTTGAQEKSC
jgi:hypothetical protein